MRLIIIALLGLTVFAAILDAPADAGGCASFNNVCGHQRFSAFGHSAHVKNFGHFNKFNSFGGFHYLPSYAGGLNYASPAQQATYKSLAQQIAEANGKEFRKILAEQAGYQSEGGSLEKPGWAVAKHCGKCHGDGGSAQDIFDTTGDWTFEKANLAQRAFMGLADAPNMAEKAGIQGDGEAIQAVLSDLSKLPLTRPAVETQPVEKERGLFGIFGK